MSYTLNIFPHFISYRAMWIDNSTSKYHNESEVYKIKKEALKVTSNQNKQ